LCTQEKVYLEHWSPVLIVHFVLLLWYSVAPLWGKNSRLGVIKGLLPLFTSYKYMQTLKEEDFPFKDCFYYFFFGYWRLLNDYNDNDIFTFFKFLLEIKKNYHIPCYIILKYYFSFFFQTLICISSDYVLPNKHIAIDAMIIDSLFIILFHSLFCCLSFFKFL